MGLAFTTSLIFSSFQRMSNQSSLLFLNPGSKQGWPPYRLLASFLVLNTLRSFSLEYVGRSDDPVELLFASSDRLCRLFTEFEPLSYANEQTRSLQEAELVSSILSLLTLG